MKLLLWWLSLMWFSIESIWRRTYAETGIRFILLLPLVTLKFRIEMRIRIVIVINSCFYVFLNNFNILSGISRSNFFFVYLINRIVIKWLIFSLISKILERTGRLWGEKIWVLNRRRAVGLFLHLRLLERFKYMSINSLECTFVHIRGAHTNNCLHLKGWWTLLFYCSKRISSINLSSFLLSI